MLPSHLLPQTALVTRPTSTVVSAQVIPSTSTLTGFSCERPAYVLAQATNPSTAATITITGTLNGVAKSESLTLVAGAVVRSVYQYSTITSIQAVGSAGTVTTTIVYAKNEPAAAYQTIATALPCRLASLSTLGGDLVPDTQGLRLAQGFRCYFNTPPTILSGDRMVIANSTYIVELLLPIYDQLGYHHTEAVLQHVTT